MRIEELTVGLGRRQPMKDLAQVRIPRGPQRDKQQNAKPPALAIGDVVQVQGELSPLPEQPADYLAYLRRAGVHAVLRTNSIVPLGTRTGPVSVLDGIRRRAEIGVGAGLDARTSALAAGIVLGQDERIPRDTVEEFQASGLAHLLAVSGQNVTLLAVLALPIPVRRDWAGARALPGSSASSASTFRSPEPVRRSCARAQWAQRRRSRSSRADRPRGGTR
jgi:hypothetical protein